MKKYNVFVKMISSQITNNNPETFIEFFGFGTLEKFKDHFELIYTEEKLSNDNKTFPVAKVTVLLQENIITITREADILSKLVLEPNTKNFCEYKTAYGHFTAGIESKKQYFNITPPEGEIYMKYSVELNGGFVSENEIKIILKSKGDTF